MEDQEFSLLLMLFIVGIGLSPMLVAGIWLLFYTDRAIGTVLKAYNRLNVFGIKPYWDPEGAFSIGVYKITGCLFMLLYILVLAIPLLVVIYYLSGGQVAICIFEC